MNGTSLNQLYHRLNALTIFRGIAEEPVICDLEDLLFAIEDNFNVVIAPSEIQRTDIDTPNKIIALIKERM